jgi:hypothetical protein
MMAASQAARAAEDLTDFEAAQIANGAHRDWVQREFDNQTVVAVYIGDTCTCSAPPAVSPR